MHKVTVHGGSGTVTFKTGFVLNSAASILCNIMSVRYGKSYLNMSYKRIVTEGGVVKDMCRGEGEIERNERHEITTFD